MDEVLEKLVISYPSPGSITASIDGYDCKFRLSDDNWYYHFLIKQYPSSDDNSKYVSQSAAEKEIWKRWYEKEQDILAEKIKDLKMTRDTALKEPEGMTELQGNLEDGSVIVWPQVIDVGNINFRYELSYARLLREGVKHIVVDAAISEIQEAARARIRAFCDRDNLF